MRLPSPPADASRFFSHVSSGYLECPRCGKLLHFQDLPRGRHPQTNAEWDKRTSRLKCAGPSGCGLTMMLGLIAWPVVAGPGGRAPARSGPKTIPRDHVPNEHQLAQLRAMGGEGAGWWMPREKAKPQFRPDHTNVTAKCTCSQHAKAHPADWKGAEGSMDCPIHGVPDPVDQVNADKWPR